MEAKICDELLYRLTVTNFLSISSEKFGTRTSTSAQRLNIEFIEPLDTEIDLIWPKGGIKDYIKAGQSCEIATLQRKDPFSNLDATDVIDLLDIKIESKEHQEPDFTMESYSTVGGKSEAKAGTGDQ